MSKNTSFPNTPEVNLARLLAKSIESPSGCMLWTGAKSSSGYGQLRVDGRIIQTHRLSYEIHVGPIPRGLEICHRCDTPACWEPTHLFEGTHTANMRDMQTKGRRRSDDVLPYGESHHDAKMTVARIQQLRSMRAIGATYKQLMAVFGISKSTVADICNRRTWRHVA